MKLANSIFTAVAFLSAALPGIAFGGQPRLKRPNLDAAIVGTWRFDMDRITLDGRSVTEEVKRLDAAHRKRAKEMFDPIRQNRLTIRKDHTYKAVGSNSSSVGTWKVVGTDVVLINKNPAHKPRALHYENHRFRVDLGGGYTTFLLPVAK